MFDLWHEAASKMAGDLRLSADRLFADHAAVRGALGSPWVERETKVSERPQVRLSDIHPLYVSLGSARDADVIAVAELAIYLMEFKDDPKIGEAISNLRDGKKYRPTLFELAMAYRWKKGGADIVLEPPIPHGLADFSAVVDGTTFIIECASFPNEAFDTDPNVLTQFLMPFASKRFAFPFSATLEVLVSEQTPGDFFGDVLRACKEALRLFGSDGTDVSVEAAFGSVRLRRTSVDNVNTRDWDVAAALVLHEPNADGSLLDVHKNPQVGEKGWVCVSMPNRRGDGYEKAREKFIEEYRQLRDVVEPRVILLDITGLTYDVLRVNHDRINDGIGQDLLERPKVSALWLLTRGFTSDGRFQYRALAMDNRNALVPLPTRLTQAVAEMEYRLDYLTGMERVVPESPAQNG